MCVCVWGGGGGGGVRVCVRAGGRVCVRVHTHVLSRYLNPVSRGLDHPLSGVSEIQNV